MSLKDFFCEVARANFFYPPTHQIGIVLCEPEKCENRSLPPSIASDSTLPPCPPQAAKSLTLFSSAAALRSNLEGEEVMAGCNARIGAHSMNISLSNMGGVLCLGSFMLALLLRDKTNAVRAGLAIFSGAGAFSYLANG